MTTAIRLGRIRGVEVIADAPVFVVAVVLGWLQYLALVSSYDASSVATILGLAVAVLYLASLLLHESLHTIVAADRGLHPRRIRLLVFGGYSMIDHRDSTPSDEFWVAIAGPLASVAAGGLLWVLALVAGGHEPTAETMRFLGTINLLIAAFNLLPGLPLDGGRALRALLWRSTGDRIRATQLATAAGKALGWGVAGFGLFVLIFGTDSSGLIWALLGWFLYRSAIAAGRREELIARAVGARARDVMRATPDAVPGTMRVAEVMELFQAGPNLRALPVAVDGRVTGILGQAEVDGLAPARLELGRAAYVMSPIGPGDIIDADTPIDEVIARSSSASRWLVVDDGAVVGMIETGDLGAALS
jgi:Zn-dependent protease